MSTEPPTNRPLATPPPPPPPSAPTTVSTPAPPPPPVTSTPTPPPPPDTATNPQAPTAPAAPSAAPPAPVAAPAGPTAPAAPADAPAALTTPAAPTTPAGPHPAATPPTHPAHVRLNAPPPAGDDRPQKGLIIGAVAIAAIVALSAIARNRSEGGAYAIGTVIGALGLMAIIGGLLWRFRSARAGLIATMAVGGLGAAANLTQLDDGSNSQREIQQAVDDLGLQTAGGTLELSDAELTCLDQSGVEPDDLQLALTASGGVTSDEQLAYLDIVARCAPRALLTDTNVEQYRASFSVGFQRDITTDEARCMLQGISEAEVPSAVATARDDEGFAELAGACLTAESIEVVRDEPGGDNPIVTEGAAFDLLAERCRDGSDPACDLLFGQASENSDYAQLSEDCAGRGLQSVSICTAGFTDTDSNGFMDETSPGWPTILGACGQGDMLACDFAYFWAELGSEGERVGETCGERREVAAAATCVALYGEQASE